MLHRIGLARYVTGAIFNAFETPAAPSESIVDGGKGSLNNEIIFV